MSHVARNTRSLLASPPEGLYQAVERECSLWAFDSNSNQGFVARMLLWTRTHEAVTRNFRASTRFFLLLAGS